MKFGVNYQLCNIIIGSFKIINDLRNHEQLTNIKQSLLP